MRYLTMPCMRGESRDNKPVSHRTFLFTLQRIGEHSAGVSKTKIQRWVFRFRFVVVFASSCYASTNETTQREKTQDFVLIGKIIIIIIIICFVYPGQLHVFRTNSRGKSPPSSGLKCFLLASYRA